jgi:hypothetical protein
MLSVVRLSVAAPTIFPGFSLGEFMIVKQCYNTKVCSIKLIV